ncbi:MAG: TetR/AcrR family transcriptional regulator [Candidatus Alcyoniella australis]|nr:TetR/AcrR family transcriptional regulator [Candidatus Alcyoniella australis]
MRRENAIKPRKAAIQQRSQFTVQQILEAATQVFSKHGYAGTTTNHIAQRAGVSIGSLYQYFPNKGAILHELVKMHLEQSTAMLDQFLDSIDGTTVDLHDILQTAVRITLELHTQNPQLHYVLLSEAIWPAEVMQQLHAIEDRFAALVQQLLASRPQVTHRHPEHAAYLMVHIVKDLAHEFVVHPPQEMDQEQFIEEIVVLLEAYLAAPHQ